METKPVQSSRRLSFAHLVGKLKSLKRTGWVMHDVPQPESVAEHSFRLAVLTLAWAKDFGADEAKAVKLALVHDLGEAIVGDIVTYRGAKSLPNMADKQTEERAAMAKIAALAGHDANWASLYDELVANESPEAKLVNQLDRLEAAIQATEYREQYDLNPTEWIENATAHVHDPELLSLIDELKRQ
jgi:5'-deoxynucleotidase